MNERQEQFIQDSMIGDEFASAVSAHDIELESPLVGEEGLARLANGQVRPIEVTINQDIRSDTDPDEIARLVSSMLTPIEDTRGNDELDQVRMALEEIATHVKPHIAHAPFTSIACAVDDALHELGQYEASLSHGLFEDRARVLLGEDGQPLRVPDHVGVLGLRQQAIAALEQNWCEQNAGTRNERTVEIMGEEILKIGLRQQLIAQAIASRSLFLEGVRGETSAVLVAGMTMELDRVMVQALMSPMLEVSSERLLRIEEGRITRLFSGEPYDRQTQRIVSRGSVD